MVEWYIPVGGKFLFGSVAAPLLVCKLSGSYLPQKIAVQFLFCFIVALCIVVVLGDLSLDPILLSIVAIGVANAFGNYASWRAQAINLSKMSLFVWTQPAIAMLLSTIFLGESQYVSSQLLLGIALNFGAIILTSYSDFRKRVHEETEEIRAQKRSQNREFYIAVASYSLIWGFANFLYKLWSLKAIPIPQFLLGWYGGSVIGALCIMYIAAVVGRDKRIFGMGQLTRKDLGYLVILSTAVLASLGSLYWSHSLAPQLVLFPLYMLGDKTFPIVVGFLFLGERGKYSLEQLGYLSIGFVGGVLILLSVRL